jgi:hypothetical protein
VLNAGDSKRGNMDIKKWIGIVIIIVVLGIAILWMRGGSDVNGRDVQVTQLNSKLPAPTSGQKKVVLKNLGMS